MRVLSEVLRSIKRMSVGAEPKASEIIHIKKENEENKRGPKSAWQLYQCS